jgi:hypothetical protein
MFRPSGIARLLRRFRDDVAPPTGESVNMKTVVLDLNLTTETLFVTSWTPFLN